jgi:hypothetical protein
VQPVEKPPVAQRHDAPQVTGGAEARSGSGLVTFQSPETSVTPPEWQRISADNSITVRAHSVRAARKWYDRFEELVEKGLDIKRSHWVVRATRLRRERWKRECWHPPMSPDSMPEEWQTPLRAGQDELNRLRSSERYANNRANALSERRETRASACGARWMTLRCKCGPYEAATDCAQPWLCDRCRRRYYGRLQRRTRAAFEYHAVGERRAWLVGGARPGAERRPMMLTLTVPHSGSVATDRELLVDGWRKLRQVLHRRIGAFPYALMFELTEGESGTPHVHAHALVCWPHFDWLGGRQPGHVCDQWCPCLAGAWKRAVGCDEARAPHITSRVRDPRTGKQRRMSPKLAANYAAKYATKGVQLGETAPELAAEAIAAWYGKRRITVSHGFWRRRESCCERCEAPWRVVGAPRPAPVPPSERMAALRARAAAMMQLRDGRVIARPRAWGVGEVQGVIPLG